MDTIDSRTLGYFDCYFRRFPSPGRVRYTLGPAGPHPAGEGPFTITVGERAARDPVQHDVTVRAAGGALQADPAELEVAPGDHVMWHAESDRTPRFSVCGSGPRGAWSSARLEDDSLLSHTFGVPGEYRLLDAAGRRLLAVLQVRNPPAAKDPCGGGEWHAAISSAAVVALDGVSFDTQRAELVVGQAAVFVVEEAQETGLTLVDERLLPPAEARECEEK